MGVCRRASLPRIHFNRKVNLRKVQGLRNALKYATIYRTIYDDWIFRLYGRSYRGIGSGVEIGLTFPEVVLVVFVINKLAVVR